MFPRDLAEIARYALNRAPQVRYRLVDLPAFLPWLYRYFLASAPDRALRGAMAVLPLIRRSLIEHELLIDEAGVPELLQRKGWIKTVSLGELAGQSHARIRAGAAVWCRRRDSRCQGDRAAPSPI